MSLYLRKWYTKSEKSHGPVFLLLHGLFGSGDNWGGLARKLSPRFRVAAPDLRNHGRSFHHRVHSYPAMAMDVHTVIKENALGPVFCVGHSMGGKVAMELALEYPENVEKLVVIDIAPREYRPRLGAVLQAVRRVHPADYGSRGEIDRALQSDLPDRLLRNFLLKNITRDRNGAYRWRVNLTALEANWASIWEEINPGRRYTGPVMFIRGDASDLVQPEDETYIRKLFPRAEVITIEGADHWVHSQKPDRVVDLLQNF